MVTVARGPDLPTITMSQSGVIIGALVAGFFIYLMMKGRLITYYNLLVGGAGAGKAPGVAGISPSSTASSNVGPSYGPTGNIFGTSRTPLYLPSWLGGGAIPGTYATFGNPAPGMSPQTQSGNPSATQSAPIPAGQTYVVSPPTAGGLSGN